MLFGARASGFSPQAPAKSRPLAVRTLLIHPGGSRGPHDEPRRLASASGTTRAVACGHLSSAWSSQRTGGHLAVPGVSSARNERMGRPVGELFVSSPAMSGCALGIVGAEQRREISYPKLTACSRGTGCEKLLIVGLEEMRT